MLQSVCKMSVECQIKQLSLFIQLENKMMGVQNCIFIWETTQSLRVRMNVWRAETYIIHIGVESFFEDTKGWTRLSDFITFIIFLYYFFLYYNTLWISFLNKSDIHRVLNYKSESIAHAICLTNFCCLRKNNSPEKW